MIDMKRRILSALLAILIFVLSLSLSSCGKESDGTFDDLYEAISIYEDMVSKQEELEALDSRKTYVIIIPVNCGAEIFNSAALLSGVMSKSVGYKVEVYYDSDIKPKSSNVEILVGETDREKSQRFAKRLRVYDYGYEYADGAVTIGAHSDTLVAEAVEAFCDGIVLDKISTVYINATKPFLVSREYEISGVTLCGFPISEYVIVYSNNNKLGEKALAEKLKKSLEEYTGYSLPVVSDSSVSDSAKFICVGKSSVTKASVIPSVALIASAENQSIELFAEDNYGLNLCIEQLLTLLKESEVDGACNLELSGIMKTAYQNEPISFYLLRDDYLSSNVDGYRNSVNGAKESSVAVFDRLSSSVLTNLRRNIGLLANISDNSFYCFDTSKFRCIESKSTLVEEGEIVTLVMENLKGEVFAFIGGFNNNKQDKINSSEFCDALSAECEKYGDLPMLVAHELSAEEDARFAKANEFLESVGVGKGIYVSPHSFEVVSNTRSEIIYPLLADTVKVKFCFK